MYVRAFSGVSVFRLKSLPAITNCSLRLNVVLACWFSARNSCISAIIIKSTRPTPFFLARCIRNAFSLPLNVSL